MMRIYSFLSHLISEKALIEELGFKTGVSMAIIRGQIYYKLRY